MEMYVTQMDMEVMQCKDMWGKCYVMQGHVVQWIFGEKVSLKGVAWGSWVLV